MISTKFGNAYKRKDGYYQISSGVHQGEYLHRLVYEDVFGPIPDGFCVRHINRDKNNNSPGNLMILSKSHNQKVKGLIKAYLLSHPGKHTSREISDWITRNFGTRRGVTPNQVGQWIKDVDMVQSARKTPNSGHKLYWIEQRGATNEKFVK